MTPDTRQRPLRTTANTVLRGVAGWAGCLPALVVVLGFAYLITGATPVAEAIAPILTGAALLGLPVVAVALLPARERPRAVAFVRDSVGAARTYLLGPSRRWWSWALQAVAAGGLVLALRPALTRVAAALELSSLPQSRDVRFLALADLTSAARVVRMGLEQALLEEWLFRGPPLLVLALVTAVGWHQRRPAAAAAIVATTSLLATAAFVAIHLAGGSANVLVAVTLGLVQLGWALLSRSLVGPMLLHLLWNGAIALTYTSRLWS